MSKIAGIYCYNYTPIAFESSKGSWYLPAIGEVIDYIYSNIMTIENSWAKLNKHLPHGYIWSSTEVDYKHAWSVGTDDNKFLIRGKTDGPTVVCVLKI